MPPPLGRPLSSQPPNLNHVIPVGRDTLTPFAARKARLLRRKLMCRTLSMRGTTPFSRYFTLFFLVHRRKTTNSCFLFHGKRPFDVTSNQLQATYHRPHRPEQPFSPETPAFLF
jgi:hypothetical protein